MKRASAKRLRERRLIGVFQCGAENVRLFIRPGTGGDFILNPSEGLAEICVGGDTSSWEDVVTSLLHEVVEMQMTRLLCRYYATADFGNDHAGYLFSITHCQFSNLCARVSPFLVRALPKLASAYRKWTRLNRRAKT